MLFRESLEGLQNPLRVLLAHQAEGEFGTGLGGQHCFCAHACIATPHAVHLSGGPRPSLLQQAETLFARQRFQTNAGQQFLFRKLKRCPLLFGGFGQRRHAFVKSGDGDFAILIVKCGDHRTQRLDRVARRATVKAGVQIQRRACHLHLLMHQPAQARGDGRGLVVPHIGVADEGDVTGQFILMGLEERHE